MSTQVTIMAGLEIVRTFDADNLAHARAILDSVLEAHLQDPFWAGCEVEQHRGSTGDDVTLIQGDAELSFYIDNWLYL